MAVRKIGQRWYYDFRVRRSRYRGVIPEARTKAQAETAEVKIRNQVFDRKYSTQADTLTLAEFIDEVYLPYARLNKRHPIFDELHCRTILAFFGKRTFSQITPFLIEKFKKERSESMTRHQRQRSPASVNRELEVLSKILSLAVDNEIIDSNPARRVKKLRQDNARKRYLTVSEEQRLMGALGGRRAHLKPVVILAIHTGMRRGELLGLRWKNVDFMRGLIYVVNTKTGYDREVPMNAKVRETLSELRQVNGEYEFVFTNPNTGVNLVELKHGFRNACDEAEIHDLMLRGERFQE